MNILVVDDESSIRKLLVAILTKSGYTVIEAEDGNKALEILKSQKIHFVISDWVMFGITGIELCQKIRNDNTIKHYIYFILLTSKNNKEELIQGMDAGADDFIVKPFNSQELKVRIRAGERIVKQEIELTERNKKLSDAYETMQKDLNAAAELQKSFLPNKDVSVNVLHKSILPNSDLSINNINFDWLFIPSQFLAGDVFNIFRLDEHHVGLYLIDIAGHGISASLMSVTLSRMLIPFQSNFLKKSTKITPFYEIKSPSKVISELNSYFSDDLDPNSMQYFTMIYMIIDTRTGKTKLSQAGHPPCIVLRKSGDISVFDRPSFPVGLINTADYEEQEFVLEKGDKVVIYSDGIVECANDKDELYEEERFTKCLIDSKDKSLDDMIKYLKNELTKWHGKEDFEDDLSLLAIEIL